MNAIFERRSIRKYTGDQVPMENIEELLRAAMHAPSAGNEQPWQFIVIDDRNILLEITKVHPFSQVLEEAKYAIAVCGDLTKEKYKGYWVQDCSAAAENILIQAQELGLGSVWLGVYPMEDRVKGVKSIMNLPDHIIPLCILPIGYPAEKKEHIDRFDVTRIHMNKW